MIKKSSDGTLIKNKRNLYENSLVRYGALALKLSMNILIELVTIDFIAHTIFIELTRLALQVMI